MRTLVLLLSAAVISVTTAHAQVSLGHGSKQTTGVRAQPGEIRLDGRLTEDVWSRAQPVTDFVQKEPVEGAQPSERTEVRFAYTDEALYVGARMYSSGGPDAIQAPLTRRDSVQLAEHVLISLDTYLDLRTAYTFGVTASGVRLDHYHRSDNELDVDKGFNPVWQAHTAIDGEGWTAEMWIPFSQLRFSGMEEHTWGLNIRRWIPTKNEEIYWIPVPRTEQAWASRFGLLTGVRDLSLTRRIEILPYAAGGSTINGARDLNDPFDDGRNLEARFGGDLKMGLGPNLTLDATVLPDFGQVEADPAVVNLTATETFYEERRPFFTEGIRLIGGNINNYFYSRRIGAPPTRVAQADYVDYPGSVDILGAAKLTGRLPSGMSIGVLGAVTGEEHARTFDLGPGEFGRVRVAPLTSWGVARIQQEVGDAGSTAAFMVAGVQRDLDEGQTLASLMPERALTVAGETLWRLFDRTWEVGISGGLTHVSGDEEAIMVVQRASPRYFQRPDAEHVELDPTRTSLTGYKATFTGTKVSGRHWLVDTYLDFESPAAEFNDIGRLTAGDGVMLRTNLTYRETQPGSFFRTYRFQAGQTSEWTFGREHQFTRLNANTAWTWNNYWTTNAQLDYAFRGQSWGLARGGPSMATPENWSTRVQLANSSTDRTRWDVTLRYGQDELGGSVGGANASVSLIPTPNLQLSVGPSIDREVNAQQYVAVRGGGSAATYGSRYIFAFIDRTTLALETRANLTLKPDLNLDIYAQPFAASGRYYDVGELAAARSLDRRVYGTDGTVINRLGDGSFRITDGAQTFALPNPDFNLRSFRSTTVLRWEWRPGSTLYLVWQQDRSRREGIGNRADLSDVLGSLGTVGSNYFAIKASYWLGM